MGGEGEYDGHAEPHSLRGSRPANKGASKSRKHRLNMELDLQSLLGSCVQLYSLAETPQIPLSTPFGLIYEGAIGQPR